MGWVGLLLGAGACGPKGAPNLELALSPKFVTDATPARVKVVATKADGTLGTGHVKITSDLGSLVTPADVQLDRYGTAVAELVCDQRVEPACASPVRVVADWSSDGVAATAETRLNPAPAGSTVHATGGSATGLLSSANILLLGTLQEGLCGRDALADPRTPKNELVGFDCYTDERSAILNQGTLYYSVTFQPGIRKFNYDTWDRDPNGGGSLYPDPDKSKDQRLYESCGEIWWFRISPSGHILHVCQKLGTGLFLDGQPFLASYPSDLHAIGDGDALLQWNGVRTTDGVVHAFSPQINGLFGPTLPVTGGFLITASNAANTCDLYKALLDGTVTRLGGYPVPCGQKIDGAGTMASMQRSGGDDTIVEVKLDGTPTTIYTEANQITPDYTVYPPEVYVLIHISSLVSGN